MIFYLEVFLQQDIKNLLSQRLIVEERDKQESLLLMVLISTILGKAKQKIT